LGLGSLQGYFGAAWYNTKTHEIVFAHRGTEADSWEDWKADGATIFGLVNPQVPVAQAFRDAVLRQAAEDQRPVDQVTHAGHSLGGCISQILAALRPDERALTFNPLGSAPLLQECGLDPNGTYANIRNVRSWFEPAAVAGSIGQTFHMPVSTYPIIPDEVESVASVLFGAAFAPPAPGMTTLPLNYQATLHAVISANWQ
jgi:pimeloyl-ACP methyl ester carboxylesterase